MKRMYRNDKTYDLVNTLGDWVDVHIDEIFDARVVNEEEARRVIWLSLKADGDSIEYISDDMFEEVGDDSTGH